MYWYKVIVRCTHLVVRILQHGCKFSRWLMVNKRSSQTVHHHSAAKFQSMLQDKKNYQPVKMLKYLLYFLYCAKKLNTNIFNHVNTDWLIISLLNTFTEKKSLENRMWRWTSGCVTCGKPSWRRNTDPDVSHTFTRRFSKQNYPKYISDVVSKITEKKNAIIRCFVWICDLPEIGCLFSCFTEPILADF